MTQIIRDVLVQFNWSNYGLDSVDDAETEWAEDLARDIAGKVHAAQARTAVDEMMRLRGDQP